MAGVSVMSLIGNVLSGARQVDPAERAFHGPHEVGDVRFHQKWSRFANHEVFRL
jgi:hypothetical protein